MTRSRWLLGLVAAACLPSMAMAQPTGERIETILERIDDPAKNWKFNAGDVKERAHWDAYMKAYEQAIGATATPHAPWYIVPADEQWETRAVVGRLLREQLEALRLERPAPDATTTAALKEAKGALESEKD